MKINKKVYVDFMYLGERVREPSGLPWSEQNARTFRQQLDKVIVAINSGTFRFHDVFPNSKKLNYFTKKENLLYKTNKSPDQVLFKDYARSWYNLLKDSGRVSGKTLLGYKSYINRYLIPFFGNFTFAELNTATFDAFISWAKQQCYRGKQVSNESINKYFVPLRMICTNAAIKYCWGNTYNPFFGFKKLPEGDSYEKIFPFFLKEQKRLIGHMPGQRKPYFLFAFCAGLRQGEQIRLKPEDIDWSNKLLHVWRAITLDENGRRVDGKTKNRYSRRTIKLTPVMVRALRAQKTIYDRRGGE